MTSHLLKSQNECSNLSASCYLVVQSSPKGFEFNDGSSASGKRIEKTHLLALVIASLMSPPTFRMEEENGFLLDICIVS